MIHFKNIHIEGFGNIISPIDFALDVQGLNILNSPNGKGKTTIFSALSWVLYGKPLKHKSEVATWEDKRPKTWKGTRVKLEIIIGNQRYFIERFLKYTGKVAGAKGASRLLIVHNGREIPHKDKAEAQKWLIKNLGMSFELFRNTIMFGQKMKRFIEEDGPTKKAIFEEVFDTAYIQQAKDRASELLSDLESELSEKLNNQNTITIRLDGVKRLAVTHGEYLEQFESDKAKQIKAKEKLLILTQAAVEALLLNYGLNLENSSKMDKLLQDLSKQVKEERDKKVLADNLSNQAFKLDFSLQQLQAEFEGSKRLEKSLVMNLAKKDFVCSLCRQKLSGKHQLEHIKQLKLQINDEKAKRIKLMPEIEEKQGILEGLNKRAKTIFSAEKLNKLESKLSLMKVEKQRLTSLEADYFRELDSLRKLKSKKPDISKLEHAKKEIAKLEESLKPLAQEIYKLNKKVAHYKWVIKDPLSNSGIKAFIFSEMVKEVNSNLDKYSSIINGKINFGINTESGNRDFYISIEKDGALRFYEDLSGGEQQLVNICIAFAMYDTITSTKPCNLLVLDECFEFLDDSNVEIVGDLIRKKAKTRTLFVVTHKAGFIPHNSNLITL